MSEDKIKRLLERAQLGDTDVQAELARIYFDGEGVAQDFGESLKWAEEAARYGDVDASHNLALHYRKGLGTRRSYRKAYREFKKSAKAGNADSQYELGELILESRFFDGNPFSRQRRAAKWFEQAAAQGHIKALYQMGLVYEEEGQYSAAIAAFHRAAEAGSVGAMGRLGYLFWQGLGLDRDPEQALHWLGKAARRDCQVSKTHLGTMLYDGDGVARDQLTGIRLVEEAAASGEPLAIEKLNDFDRVRHLPESGRSRRRHNLQDDLTDARPGRRRRRPMPWGDDGVK